MAAALFRRETRLCMRCIHRTLCRVVWRSQTALFSTKLSDAKQPRRTHIKKAKPQPPVDVYKLLEQLYSQRRPGTSPPADRLTKASSETTKSPATSSMQSSTSNVPPHPAIVAFPAASSFKQPNVSKKTSSSVNTASLSAEPNSASPTNATNSSETLRSPLDFSQPGASKSVSHEAFSPTGTAAASTAAEAAADEQQTSAETIEIHGEMTLEFVELKSAAVEPFPAHKLERDEGMPCFSADTAEPLTQTGTESVVEASGSTAAVVEDPVKPPVEVSAEEQKLNGAERGEKFIESTVESPVETSSSPDVTGNRAAETQSQNPAVVDISNTVEPLTETTGGHWVEESTCMLETLENRDADGQGPDKPEVNVSGVSKEPLIETTLESPVEARTFPTATLEVRAVSAECQLEPTIVATVDTAAEPKNPNSAVVDNSNKVEPLIETTGGHMVEGSSSRLETLENRDAIVGGSVEGTFETNTAAQDVKINAPDSGVVNPPYGPTEEPSIETTVETATSPVESRAAFSKGTVEPTAEDEAADSLCRTLRPNAQESAPLNLKVESVSESTVDPSSGNDIVGDGANKSEKMTLESVTLHEVESEVESFKMDELLEIQSTLDQKAEKELRDMLVQTVAGAENDNAAVTENSNDGESEVLTETLSKWETLSEDLQELEGESMRLELICHVPASSATDPAVGEEGESVHTEEDKGTEAMTFESVTLSKVKVEVEALDTKDLLETWNALEKEVPTKEETTEVKTPAGDVPVLEDTTEAKMLTLDSISEATDAIEAEASVILEAMFGSEQGARHPPGTSLAEQKQGQQIEAIDQDKGKESREGDGRVLEAMTLESVTLAEVEASFGALETQYLSETTDYLNKEAGILAGEKRMEEEENGMASEETTEALEIQTLASTDGDALPEDLQTDTLMEEMLFCIPGHVRAAESPYEQNGAYVLDVAIGPDDADSAAEVTGDVPASSAPKEVQVEPEVEEERAQTEASGNEDDLDPVQRLFIEKIREYNTCGLNEGLQEVEPYYKKYLSEETAKLQRLYGGGDLSSFPEFTFTEPKLDEDSK